jgi:transcriptional regulator with XRE-family HTH domain
MARGGRKGFRSAQELGYNAVLGARIEASRKKAGITAKRLAERIGCWPSQLTGWETGEFRCPPFYLAKIARTLEVPVSSLIPNFTLCELSGSGTSPAPKTV